MTDFGLMVSIRRAFRKKIAPFWQIADNNAQKVSLSWYFVEICKIIAYSRLLKMAEMGEVWYANNDIALPIVRRKHMNVWLARKCKTKIHNHPWESHPLESQTLIFERQPTTRIQHIYLICAHFGIVARSVSMHLFTHTSRRPHECAMTMMLMIIQVEWWTFFDASIRTSIGWRLSSSKPEYWIAFSISFAAPRRTL